MVKVKGVRAVIIPLLALLLLNALSCGMLKNSLKKDSLPSPSPVATPSPTAPPRQTPKPTPSPTAPATSPSPTPSPQPTLTPLPIPIEGVYLAPSLLKVKPGSSFMIKVMVRLTERGVSAGEINLKYNPKAFKVEDMVPGNLLGPSPLVGAYRIDEEAGKAKYALGRVGPTPVPTPPGTFAIIKFTVLDSAPKGIHSILLESVGFADQNFELVPNIEIQGCLIIVQEEG